MKGVIAAVVMIGLATSAYCEKKNLLSLIFSGGTNLGSIVRTGSVDAVSSASQWGGQGGVHAEIGISGHFIETGLDYSYYKDDLIYQDANNSINGTRSFALHSLSLPIMYNFHFFNRKNGDPNLIVGVGLLCSVFPYQEVGETGTLSGYNLKNWAAGPSLQIDYYPLEIEEKYLLGLYLNLYRSISQFYTDAYYIGTKTGDLGILDLGFGLRMRL